jgi:hypothetical protein
MNDKNVEYCLVFLSDPAFSVFTQKPISNDLKAELLKNALPQGSRWKYYAGMRSISFFPLKALSSLYALSYSVITSNIATPIVSFIIILNREVAEKIIANQISGIENAFYNGIEVFASLDNTNTKLLKDSLANYKSLKQPTDSGNLKRFTAGGQMIFASKYNNHLQWKIVESMVLEKSAKSLFSFRTFALQREQGFQVIGIVASDDNADNSNTTRSSGQSKKTLTFIVVSIWILVIIVCCLIVFFAQQASR